ncbi:HAD family hydrolase [Winogradskyella tangerina]|uniref:HAD family hydrolase n=1 Tax=Winogradskyella tangerina TaxID=2023240 RepID=UPI000DBE3A87|nr:HAD family hydrolase [Winogradskyella tangerina]
MSLKDSTIFKNIFFDFDGVIAESVDVKTEAFREMYLPYGEKIADKVVDHHIHNGGVSRYEKFKIYHKQFLNQDISQDQLNDLAQTFSKLVLEKVINAEEVVGCSNFLDKYSTRLNFWIITGTPTVEIEQIVEKRGIENHFKALCGSPKNKRYWTEYIIKENNLKRHETLFLGDATTDYDAADFSNIHFALREHHENMEVFKDFNGIRFKTFTELEKEIQKYL